MLHGSDAEEMKRRKICNRCSNMEINFVEAAEKAEDAAPAWGDERANWGDTGANWGE
jgi:hypothetical protein